MTDCTFNRLLPTNGILSRSHRESLQLSNGDFRNGGWSWAQDAARDWPWAVAMGTEPFASPGLFPFRTHKTHKLTMHDATLNETHTTPIPS